MQNGLTSIIIPTYQHGDRVAAAIESALAQTAPVEVIVIDDGSTDNTLSVLERYAPRIRANTLEHGGPSLARNAGIEMARGEFLMFLDADDVIDRDKVRTQVDAMTPDVGWVLCDVRIENEATGKTVNASEQYAYAAKDLGGWIKPQLGLGNFIPIMSPLFRRSAIGDHIRFDDSKIPEDWHFWYALAGVARVRYVPRVLATYRKGRTGRSRLPLKARRVVRNIEQPLRLNLGCGTPNTRSWHPMPGMVNLDRSLGWKFEDGLGDFVDGSVAGITISHALMYVALEDWPRVFSEFARVLAPGGVLRITEDDATNPESPRYGGWKGSEPAVTLTDAKMVREHMERVGLASFEVDRTTSRFRDGSLRQAQHGEPPSVFFAEGVRQTAVLFSPHNDDETLFACFTLLRYRPRVVVCFPSSGDYGASDVREGESREVVDLLGAGPLEQWDGGNLIDRMRALDAAMAPERVWAPSERTSHADHKAVALAALKVFGDRVTRYHTYGADGKIREGTPVPFEFGWTAHKLRALSRYRTQIEHPRANKFFMDDLAEFYDE